MWNSKVFATLVAIVGAAAAILTATMLLPDRPGPVQPGAEPAPRTRPPTGDEAGAGRPTGGQATAGGPTAAPGAASATPHPAGGDDVRSVRFDFDAGVTGSVVDRSGQLRLRPRSANGGRLVAGPGGDGLAVRFPARCRTAADQCPRAILEATPADSLSPGRRAVRWGAALQLAPEDTANGANVLQKGYATTSQFKLQVDGGAGRPSCAVVGSGPTPIYLVVADVTVADGRWHTVDCARKDAILSITVDGKQRASISIPPRLSIVSDQPLRIGGKGLRSDNDQFAGALDDVYVRIGRG